MSNLKVVAGVTMTPPAIGRIMMGHTEGGNESSRARPVRDDHFTITTLTQLADRKWEEHPIIKKIGKAKEKLTAIPVRIAYNDPNLSLHNRFTCFDQKNGRTLCSGNGATARRATEDGVQTIDCPRPDNCTYGTTNRCKSFSRFYIRIEGQDDELGVFVLRTASHNSLDRLGGRLNQLHGLTGGLTAGMPMLLTINAKTSAMSYRKPFWFADLVQRPGMSLAEAAKQAREWQEGNNGIGLSQEGLEESIRAGLETSDFADEIEDLEEWLTDEDLAAEAERNLQKQGLRGLDSLAAVRAPAVANTLVSAPADPIAPEGIGSAPEKAVPPVARPVPPVPAVFPIPAPPTPMPLLPPRRFNGAIGNRIAR